METSINVIQFDQLLLSFCKSQEDIGSAERLSGSSQAFLRSPFALKLMIYTLTLNPSIDQHITIKKLVKDDKIKAETIRFDPGGKGFNVSRVVRELGGQTKAFGPIGGHEGRILRDLMIRHKIDHRFFEIPNETRINLIVTDLSDRSQTRINAVGPRLDAACIRQLFEMIEHVRPRPSYWALSGSIPPGVSDDIYRRLITCLQKRGERCVLDTDEKPLKMGLKARPFMIKPNEYELARLIGRSCRSDRQLLAAGRKLAETVEVVAISLANNGALIVTQGRAWRIEGVPVKVKSKVGAGDSFIAGFLTALDRGKDIETAGRYAVASGTASVMQDGTALGKKADVERLVRRVKVHVINS